jgi:hypothetical protein
MQASVVSMESHFGIGRWLSPSLAEYNVRERPAATSAWGGRILTF